MAWVNGHEECDRCGKRLYSGNRVYNLCKECNEWLENCVDEDDVVESEVKKEDCQLK